MDDLAGIPSLAEATDAERQRFLTARKGDVAATTSMLSKHLDWRRSTLPLAAGQPRFGAGLPEWIVFHGHARDLSPVCHCQGAMYDPEKGTAQQYANATAQCFDEALPRDSDTKITLLCDVRGDADWPNAKGSAFIPVVRAISALLGDHFPERLRRLIIYPMPWAGMAIWGAIKPFIDPNTAQKVIILPGSSKRGAPCPIELGEYIEYSQIREDRRHRHTSLLDAEKENGNPNLV